MRNFDPIESPVDVFLLLYSKTRGSCRKEVFKVVESMSTLFTDCPV